MKIISKLTNLPDRIALGCSIEIKLNQDINIKTNCEEEILNRSCATFDNDTFFIAYITNGLLEI